MGEVSIKAKDLEGCGTSEDQAIRNLWAATLQNAVDALKADEIPGFFEDDRDPSKKRVNQLRAREIMHAKWFFTPGDESALVWICEEVLGLNVDQVRRRAFDLIERHNLDDYVARNVNVYTKMREKELMALRCG